MYQPKPTAHQKEYKNEIMVFDPFYDSPLTSAQKEEKRMSGLEKGHVWQSFDPAETNVGFRQERRFSNKIIGEKTLRFSIYHDPFEFQPSLPNKGKGEKGKGEKKLPNYGFLDEALCLKCKKNAKWVFENKYYCGTHSKVKDHPNRKEILHGRKKSEFINDESKWKSMFEYENIVEFLNHLDYEEVRYVVIERQMAINYRSTRMAQHLITSLFFLLRERGKYYPVIYEINPKIKSRVYGVRLPKPELKKWTLRKAIMNAVHLEEVGFLSLLVKDDWPEKLIKMNKEGELTEIVLWDLIEPERNITVAKDRAKVKREECILTRSYDNLYDVCDAKEQIESLVIELNLPYQTMTGFSQGEVNKGGQEGMGKNLPKI